MKIADMVVPESNNRYPYRAFLKAMLNSEVEVMKTRLKCVGSEEDISLDVMDPAGANRERKALEAKFNNSKMMRQIGRLHSDPWHQEELIHPEIKLDVQLVPALPAFFIKTAAPGDGARRCSPTSTP